MSLLNRGFSLLELLVTILLAALILGIGLPSLGNSIARQRQTAEINALFHALYLARKESIRRRRFVSICPSADGLNCTPGRDWTRGWLMFENTDRDEPPDNDPGEPVILVHAGDPQIEIRANRRGFTSRTVHRRATNGTLVYCDPKGRISPKALVVSYTGRPRVATRQRNGRPYECTD